MSASPPGQSFDGVAEEYERGRPGWPSAALDVPDIPSSAAVLDLAAGTGKLTRALVRRFRRVVAVEPLPAMRRLLELLVPEAEARAGTAEAIPLADRAVDGVFCGEAYHWFDWERALAEIARVLRPGGALVLLWNRPAERQRTYWPAEVEEVLRGCGVEGGQRYAAPGWRESFAGSPFEPLRFVSVPNHHEVDRKTLLARIASQSFVAAKPEGERAALVAAVAAQLALERYGVEMETHVHWTRLSR